MSATDTPPPVLHMARVLAFAVLDESVRWTGRQRVYVDGKELGPVPRLALCQNVSGGTKDFLVFYCDDDWEVLGITGGRTLDSAKASAERAYSGVTAKWVETGVPVEAAEAWIEDNCEEIICSFCGREAGEFTSVIESKTGVRICNRCVDEFYAEMRKTDD
jgi:ClpX C4-type zinc finger